MARQTQIVEVNKFNAGLITDASPLTAPDNSSLEEENFVLNIDGSRNRRLGLDFEEGFSQAFTQVNTALSIDLAVSNYNWGNAGGRSDKDILVVQVGDEVQFFDTSSTPISDGFLFRYQIAGASSTQPFSYAVVDGVLIVVTGLGEITSFRYSGGSISVSGSRLTIRDMFGLEEVEGSIDYTVGSNVSSRSATGTTPRIYNLRNQGWGVPRIIENQEVLGEPISNFVLVGGVYPANSDTVIEALYPDAEDTDNRLVDRFFPSDLYNNPLGTTRAPMGYFIIDALERGDSREQQYAVNMARYSTGLTLNIGPLQEDRTPTGATVVAEFAGRAWYAGFSGEVIDGDSKSPRMSSYILFSKIVENISDITQCYQEGDPTSKNSPDILDTDGGFIRINEAYGIVSLINLGSFLLVIASNGIWKISGGDNGFTATTYIVEKVSDRGCNSPNSILLVENTVMYWGDDGIYHVRPDQYGSYSAVNISFGKIQRFFDTISTDDRRRVQGAYDNYEHKARWIIGNRTNSTTPTRELVLDVTLQAYYLNAIRQIEGTALPRILTFYKSNPYEVDSFGISRREYGYVVMTQTTPVVAFSFASYRNQDFREWYSIDNIGVDADATLITSYMSGGDYQRDKQFPYITIHLRRTEDGFDVNSNPINQSSCIVQARWDWSDSDRSGKWGREFQAYRYRNLYIPQDNTDDFDNGFTMIVTRNKVRGNGRVLSLKFKTEPYRNLHLYGWSMILSVADNV